MACLKSHYVFDLPMQEVRRFCDLDPDLLTVLGWGRDALALAQITCVRQVLLVTIAAISQNRLCPFSLSITMII